MMPTYEYRCDGCGHEMEAFESITAKPQRKCPECGRNKLKRLIGTGAGVLFKGEGFWQTDYRSESYKQGQKAESGGGESKGDGQAEKKDAKDKAKTTAAEKKTEKKPAAKKESGGSKKSD